MAANRQGVDYRRTYSKQRYSGQQYVYGNTVRQPEQLPKRSVQRAPERKRQASSQVKKNRNRALDMSRGYVVFLAVAAFIAVMACVGYLRLQAEIVNRSENITMLQRELSDLTEQNDTAYNAVLDSVNLEDIRYRAMNELGMVYASQGRVVEYDSPTKGYVTQYSDIPSDGVLAKSKSVKD